MAKVKWRGGAMLAPVPPTMVTCSHDGKDNVFTVAWTGITNTIPPKTYISVRPSRHSYKMIKESGEFAINLTPASLAKAADYCGVYTGKKVDKFKKCGLEKLPAYGEGIYMGPQAFTHYKFPMISDAERKNLIKYWTKPKLFTLFSKSRK